MSGKIDAQHAYVVGKQGNQPIEGSQIVQPSVNSQDRSLRSITIPTSGDVTPRCRYSNLLELQNSNTGYYVH